MEVLVEYAYEAQEADELTLKVGEIVTNVVQKLDGWWEGNLGLKRGLFPDNFVRVIGGPGVQSGKDEVFSETVQLRKKPATRRLKALFSYSPEQDDELALEVGDVLDFISEVEDGWFKGSLKGKTGIFPSNFVADVEQAPTTNGTQQQQDIKSNPTHNNNMDNRSTYIKASPDVIPVVDRTSQSSEDEPAPKLPPKPVRDLARCFFSYVAQNEDELTLNEGDIVTVISKCCEDDGWWKGELRGRIGLFPDNFVKVMSANEAQTASTTTASSAPQQKILAQGRNIAGIVAGDASLKKETSSTELDGAASTKIDKNFQSNKKVKSVKPDLKDLPLGVPTSTKQQPMTPPSPVSPRGVSYLANISLKPTAKREPVVAKREQPEDDSAPGEDFNAVERNEKLSHLTANRAKAPKRRPPSTILTRENEPGVVNGSLDTSIDSPHQTSHNGPSYSNSSSFSSGSFNSTPSTVVVSDGSNISTPPNRNSRELDTSITSNANSSETSTPATGAAAVAKPKQKLLPWMAELKQTQEKRALVTSPNAPSSNSGSPAANSSNNSSNTSISTSSSPTPAVTSTPPLRSSSKDKEKDSVQLSTSNLQTTSTTKAPPLPAKPVMPSEKVPSSANVNSSPVTVTTTPTNTSTVSTFSLKFGGVGRKISTTSASAAATTNNYVNTVTTTSTSVNPPAPALLNNSNTSNNHGTTSINASTNDAIHNASGNNKGQMHKPDFVPYQEFVKLQDRVHFLESELNAIKKQLQDRDGNKGHIV